MCSLPDVSKAIRAMRRTVQSKSIAIYKLPDAATYIYMEQLSEPATFTSIASLNGRHGFVFAPFAPSAQCPVVLIEPDRVEQRAIDEEIGGGIVACQLMVEEAQTLADRADYGSQFGFFHGLLTARELQKVVLSRRDDVKTEGQISLDALFCTAAQRYPHQMVALVSTPHSGTWLMATPEILVDQTTDGWRTMALAGTMRTPGPWSEKNQEEQRLVAEYIRRVLSDAANDITLSATYSRMAAQLFHLCTDITFSLPSDSHVATLLSRLHPTPAVCGLPTEKARQMILNHESTPRKYYSGFLGPMMMPDNGTHLFVSLRCMEIGEGSVSFYAGGGLLAESREDDEWQETENKMLTMRGLFDSKQS